MVARIFSSPTLFVRTNIRPTEMLAAHFTRGFWQIRAATRLAS